MHYYHPRWLHLAEECVEGGAVKLLLHHRVLAALQDHPPLALLLVKLLETCLVARVIEGGEGGAGGGGGVGVGGDDRIVGTLQSRAGEEVRLVGGLASVGTVAR